MLNDYIKSRQKIYTDFLRIHYSVVFHLTVYKYQYAINSLKIRIREKKLN